MPVNKVLSQTFTVVAGMLGITALTSYFSLGLKMGIISSIVLLLISFGLIFFINAKKNSELALWGLGFFSIVQGLTLGPLVNHYLHLHNGPAIVGGTTALTAVATAVCAAIAIKSKKDFSAIGGFLMAGTIVLLLALLVGVFFPSTTFILTVSALGALLFCGWIIYDVNMVVMERQTNYALAALSIYLDILNLFVNLLRIVGVLGSSDD